MAAFGDAILLEKSNYIEIQDDDEYRIAGVQSYGKGIVIRKTVKGSELTMKKYQVIKKNHLMWCKVDTKNGTFGLTHDEHVGALASTNMVLAKIQEDKFIPQFIETLFQLKSFYEWITKYSSGSTNRKYLTPKELMIKVEIPNLSKIEQKVFQNKVSFLNSCGFFSELTQQQTLLKKLRQQILQEAIEGKLTADWRKHNPNTEPASELLKRIQVEKVKLIKDKKIKPQKPLPQISEKEKPFPLPEGWEWCRLGDISNYGNNLHIVPNQIASNTWVLDLEDIEKSTSKLLYKATQAERKTTSNKNIFLKNDLLYGKLRPYLDKVFIADDDGVCTTEIMAVRFLGNINPWFIRISMKSYYFLSYVNTQVSGMRMPRLKTDSGKNSLIPLPPLAEQKTIVSKVEKMFALCDQLETQIKENQTHAESLMQAVLKEAFTKSDSQQYNQS